MARFSATFIYAPHPQKIMFGRLSFVGVVHIKALPTPRCDAPAPQKRTYKTLSFVGPVVAILLRRFVKESSMKARAELLPDIDFMDVQPRAENLACSGEPLLIQLPLIP